MGENSKEDMDHGFLPNSISEFLKELSKIDDFSLKIAKLKSFIYIHEEEFKKVSVFKREVPFCMRLLKDVIEKLKDEAEECERREKEEFLRNSDKNGGSKKSIDINDKKDWLSNAQLWSTPVHYELFDLNSEDSSYREKGESSVEREKLLKSNQKCEVGSIDLSLQVNGHGGLRSRSHNKKQRRCWSPELHRRFVNALEELGGAQVATPKQIREIMREEGLTNDEVKSHLQKYRIHIRRLPSTSTAPPPSCKRLLQDQSGEFSTSSVVQTASPQGPLHLGGSARAASMVGADSMEEEEEKPETQSTKNRLSDGH